MKQKVSIFWYRRDLRLDDNAGLYYTLRRTYLVLPLFIFDREILDKLENKHDARVDFIHKTISDLNKQLAQLGSTIGVRYGKPFEVWEL